MIHGCCIRDKMVVKGVWRQISGSSLHQRQRTGAHPLFQYGSHPVHPFSTACYVFVCCAVDVSPAMMELHMIGRRYLRPALRDLVNVTSLSAGSIPRLFTVFRECP